MNKNKIKIQLTIVAVLLCTSTFAQYPSVPKGVQDSVNQMMKKEWELSDKAFEKALPIIEKEAKEGRPYIPWASRPSDLPQAEIPAFPGAYGGGAYSFGGRGGKVCVVTSLEDRGPGTLREACEQGGARIIVFNVAGIIHLKTPLIIRAPYITIAGQTAPGDGICIAGESIWINTHDAVIRHLKLRRGETWVGRR
ncbi:MAG: polysaccharide lyase, partial [Bacteroidales bacterium]|nr:polysaccharide lyase [Bacteroidales bacterium]